MCSVEHIPGPPHFKSLKVFFKEANCILPSIDKQGEVTSEKYNQRDVIRRNIKTGFV